MQMSCLGCDQVVCNMEPGELMAIACSCGAAAPILRSHTGQWAAPASLALMRGNEPPHLEYYLGYSDHESEGKSVYIDLLLGMGATWQVDCPEEECQRDIERHRDREERRNRVTE